jgi:hypothetical protein
MAVGLSEILSALQNGVTAINDLNTRLSQTFLQQGTLISSAITTANSTITFTSSQAAGFIAVETSSGAAGYIAWYR